MKKRIIALLTFLMPAVSFAEDMNLEAFRISASGAGLTQIVVDKNRNMRVDVEVAPEVGVFVYEGLEVFGRLRLTGPIFVNAASSFQQNPITFGASLGARYFLDTGTSFYPYAGMSLGVDAVETLGARYWTFEIPIGVMVALNESVGLTLGAAFKTETTFFDNISPSLFYFPMGIFGVKALFN